MATTQLCTFYLGKLFFAVEVEAVQEVIRYQETTPVPLSSNNIRGLINLRGEIVTAIDLRERLSIESGATEEPMNVVLRIDNSVVSLLVDEVGDVLDVPTTTLETPPQTLQSTIHEFMQGVYKMENRLLLLLDADKVVNVSSKPTEVADATLH